MSNGRHYRSISKKLPIIISTSIFVMLLIVLIVTFWRMERRMVNEYRQMAAGVTNLMADVLEPDKMDYYLQENYNSERYRKIMKFYYALRDNFPDIQYLYVYHMYDGEVPSGTVIFDLENDYTGTPSQAALDEVGSTYIILEPFASRIDELTGSSEPIFDTAFSQEDGYLLSYARPILDEDGNYVASACVDFSMDRMHQQNLRFILILGAILVLASLVILALSILAIRRVVTNPLRSISTAVSSFRHETEGDIESNLDFLSKMGMDRDDEIGMLFNAVTSSEKDTLNYMNSLKKAEDEIHDKNVRITELGSLALRDSMTNVGNKAAFTARVSEIKDSDAYGIVLMDVNGLKTINDSYGHEAGDEYIKGCCTVLCDVFSHSPVFRIGGDEFSVILKGRDYENRHELMKNITEAFEHIWREHEDDPPHRYSASVGMADSTTCSSTRETIKTADESMYENKRAFKERNESSRQA